VLRRLARPRDLPVVRRLLTGLILESNQAARPGPNDRKKSNF